MYNISFNIKNSKIRETALQNGYSFFSSYPIVCLIEKNLFRDVLLTIYLEGFLKY